MSIIIDISLPLTSSVASWPGDTPFDFHLNWQKSNGSSVNVGSITTSLHSGTHADSPFHFDDNGASIEKLDLAAFIGPAIVIDVCGKDVISVNDLKDYNFNESPRVLFKTDAWLNHTVFPETIPVIDGDVPAFLKERGVVLAVLTSRLSTL